MVDRIRQAEDLKTASLDSGPETATVDAVAADGRSDSAAGYPPATRLDTVLGDAAPGMCPGPAAITPDERTDGGAQAEPRSLGRVGIVPGYEIVRELGRGGMGVVYLARHAVLDRNCALKMILAGTHAGPDASARFLVEARAAARLIHPNSVQVYSVGEADGIPYLELEYAAGGSLQLRLDGTPWTPRSAVELVLALGGAMSEAHRHGLVHRDLKPSNILIASDGTPKVSDFGLARAMDSGGSLTSSGAILGSPCYMAPEQAEGRSHEAGPPADVYALGAVLYELLTGRPPLRDASKIETLRLVQAAEPVAPSRLVPSLPGDLETICLKCLRKEPAKRYATATELVEDLSRFLGGKPVVARRARNTERLAAWSRRNPVVAGLAAALLLTAVAVFGGVLLQWRRAEATRRDLDRLLTDFRAWQANDSRFEELRGSRITAYSLLERGDEAGYRRACLRMLKRFGTTDDPWVAAELALTCMQGPDAIADLNQVVRLAEHAVAANLGVPWWQHALAGMYLRTARYNQAQITLDASDGTTGWVSHVLNDLVRALVHIRQGNRVEGRRYLDAALRWRDEHTNEFPVEDGQPAGMPPFDWVSFQILQREAEALLRAGSDADDPRR
jgi:hypothetical protein